MSSLAQLTSKVISGFYIYIYIKQLLTGEDEEQEASKLFD